MTSLAQPPQVVGTISPAGLAAFAALPPQERMVDLVEARFDLALPAAGSALPPEVSGFRAAFVEALSFCARLERDGMPVLATLRLVPDGGRWPEDAGRLPWFEDALAIASWVDVEVESAIAAPVIGRARALGRRVIVSHHDFDGTADVDALGRVIERCRALGPDVVKVATLVGSLEDHDRLLEIQRGARGQAGAPLALVGMGALGTPLRSYLPAVGSRLTYGFLDTAAAPGQLHAHELVRRLLADCPAYAAHRRNQVRP